MLLQGLCYQGLCYPLVRLDDTDPLPFNIMCHQPKTCNPTHSYPSTQPLPKPPPFSTLHLTLSHLIQPLSDILPSPTIREGNLYVEEYLAVNPAFRERIDQEIMEGNLLGGKEGLDCLPISEGYEQDYKVGGRFVISS